MRLISQRYLIISNYTHKTIKSFNNNWSKLKLEKNFQKTLHFSQAPKNRPHLSQQSTEFQNDTTSIDQRNKIQKRPNKTDVRHEKRQHVHISRNKPRYSTKSSVNVNPKTIDPTSSGRKTQELLVVVLARDLGQVRLGQVLERDPHVPDLPLEYQKPSFVLAVGHELGLDTQKTIVVIVKIRRVDGGRETTPRLYLVLLIGVLFVEAGSHMRLQPDEIGILYVLDTLGFFQRARRALVFVHFEASALGRGRSPPELDWSVRGGFF